jgi:hypothetical protein
VAWIDEAIERCLPAYGICVGFCAGEHTRSFILFLSAGSAWSLLDTCGVAWIDKDTERCLPASSVCAGFRADEYVLVFFAVSFCWERSEI